MNTSFLRGTGVALVTPMDEDGEIDFAGFERLLAHTGKYVDYFVVQGTTGESPTIKDSEKRSLVDFVKKNNEYKRPVVLGVGGNNTQKAVETIKKTDFEGISAILSVCPYYNNPTQAGIVAHFTKIADSSPVPVILYNVPSRTVANMSAEAVLELAAHPAICGIKEASGNIVQCCKIAAGMPKDFQLVSGDDFLTLPKISVGATGVISVIANVIPEIYCAIVQHALDNNFAMAREKLFRIIELNRLMYVEGNPTGVKQALAIRGICQEHVRLPLLKASPMLKAQIETELRTLLA